jgi:hypothetical protein
VKLATHIHLVSRLRIVDLYLHSRICIRDMGLIYTNKYEDNFQVVFMYIRRWQHYAWHCASDGQKCNLIHCFNGERRERNKDIERIKGRKWVKEQVTKEIISCRISRGVSAVRLECPVNWFVRLCSQFLADHLVVLSVAQNTCFCSTKLVSLLFNGSLVSVGSFANVSRAYALFILKQTTERGQT